MNETAICDLLHVKHVIDSLKAIDQLTLTLAERDACNDTLTQTYDRAAYSLAREEVQRVLEGEGERKEAMTLPPSLLLPQTPSSSLTTHACFEQGTAEPMIDSRFFAFLFWQDSLPYDTPIARHPNQFFREPLPLKNWPRTHLAMWSPSHGNAFSCQ